MEKCCDNYSTTFDSYSAMLAYQRTQTENSQWLRSPVNELSVEALEPKRLDYERSEFAYGVGEEAIEDTANRLGLALKVKGDLYPVRETAYKTLLDRAKINGTALPKLSRGTLAGVLNECLHLFESEALVLVRDEKVSAVHSGDKTVYAVLPIDELLETLDGMLGIRFPDSVFTGGYADHSIVSGMWTMPKQKESLLGAYTKMLDKYGISHCDYTPGIRFVTSDTGIASAKVSALLFGGKHPIHIGGCVAVDHRHGATISDFEKALNLLFAQFGDSIKKLEKLLNVYLNFPVNAMAHVCKKLALPKKAALAAIKMFEDTYVGGIATAHDVFMAMQEILFTLSTENTPQSKMLFVEESLARALTLNWSDYDLAKGVNY